MALCGAGAVARLLDNAGYGWVLHLCQAAVGENRRELLQEEDYAEVRLQVTNGALEVVLGHLGEHPCLARVLVEKLPTITSASVYIGRTGGQG